MILAGGDAAGAEQHYPYSIEASFGVKGTETVSSPSGSATPPWWRGGLVQQHPVSRAQEDPIRGEPGGWREWWDDPDDSAELRARAEVAEQRQVTRAELLGVVWQGEILEERRRVGRERTRLRSSPSAGSGALGSCSRKVSRVTGSQGRKEGSCRSDQGPSRRGRPRRGGDSFRGDHARAGADRAIRTDRGPGRQP